MMLCLIGYHMVSKYILTTNNNTDTDTNNTNTNTNTKVMIVRNMMRIL